MTATVSFHRVTQITDVRIEPEVGGDTHYVEVCVRDEDNRRSEVTWFFETKADLVNFVQELEDKIDEAFDGDIA